MQLVPGSPATPPNTGLPSLGQIAALLEAVVISGVFVLVFSPERFSHLHPTWL
jgi:hypothetical protein